MDKRTDWVVVILSHLPWDFPCDFIKHTTLELAYHPRLQVDPRNARDFSGRVTMER